MSRLVLACLWFVLAAHAALGNGAIAERRAGGLVFKQSDTVSIEREDLGVSLNKVTVDYLFKSEAAATQTVTIAFPMPGVSSAAGT